MKMDETATRKTARVLKYSCEDCSRQFRFKSTYLKHKNVYPYKHQYHMCCKKFDTLTHVCKLIKKKLISETEECKSIKEKIKKTKVDDDTLSDNEINIEEKMEQEIVECSNESDYFDKTDTKRIFTKRTKEKMARLEKCSQCNECNKMFTNAGLKNHIRTVHGKNEISFKCHICEEKFTERTEYDKHVNLHDPEDKVMCKGCKKVFDSLRLYQAHAKQNPGVHCFLCKLCLRKFPSELLLEQHVCICTNGQPMVCACGRRFTRYQDVIQHSNGTKPFRCCTCKQETTSLTTYLRHIRRHSKQKFYECTKCKLSFALIDFYNIHLKKVHGVMTGAEMDYECQECKQKYSSAEELKEHSLQHERVSCPDCGKSLKRSRLEEHRNSHKRSASLCPECGKLFETRFKLSQHIITSHNSDPVKCEVCDKVLKTKKILKEHMKTHLKSEIGMRIPQAICPICGLGLAQKGSLARHILLMHEKHKIVPCNRTFTCMACKEVLPTRSKYYSHHRMHRAMVDRFPCQFCGREFNKKQNLKRHIYLLHDERRIIEEPIYTCGVCARSFREKKNLRRHYRMVHKWEDINL